MTRQRLPNRRLQLTEVIAIDGRDYLIGIGFDVGGRAREAFVAGAKVGSAMEALLQDGCVMLSMLLQLGMAPEVVARALGREGVDPGSPHASALGAIARRLAAIEADAGAAIRAAYATVSSAAREFEPAPAAREFEPASAAREVEPAPEAAS